MNNYAHAPMNISSPPEVRSVQFVSGSPSLALQHPSRKLYAEALTSCEERTHMHKRKVIGRLLVDMYVATDAARITCRRWHGSVNR